MVLATAVSVAEMALVHTVSGVALHVTASSASVTNEGFVVLAIRESMPIGEVLRAHHSPVSSKASVLFLPSRTSRRSSAHAGKELITVRRGLRRRLLIPPSTGLDGCCGGEPERDDTCLADLRGPPGVAPYHGDEVLRERHLQHQDPLRQVSVSDTFNITDLAPYHGDEVLDPRT